VGRHYTFRPKWTASHCRWPSIKCCRKYPNEAQQLWTIRFNLLLDSHGYREVEVHLEGGERHTLHRHDNSTAAARCVFRRIMGPCSVLKSEFDLKLFSFTVIYTNALFRVLYDDSIVIVVFHVYWEQSVFMASVHLPVCYYWQYWSLIQNWTEPNSFLVVIYV
jgi:hypothetical protein